MRYRITLFEMLRHYTFCIYTVGSNIRCDVFIRFDVICQDVVLIEFIRSDVIRSVIVRIELG